MALVINLNKISRFWIYAVIVVLTFIVYGNSINNEYSLDDNIVVEGNTKVEKGILAIPEIFTTSYATDNKQNYGYRPIVLTSFAIEKQLFKKFKEKQTSEEKKKKDKLTQANISHFINVLLYAITCLLLFIVLQKIFPAYNFLFAFFITVLFLVHPLHTEVVCSIKNRDEILVFLSMLLSINYFINYSKTNNIKELLLAFLFVVISLLTKNNAMAIIGIAPIVLYFIKASNKTIVVSLLSSLVLFVGFGFLQKSLFNQEQIRIFEYFENPLMHEDWSIKRISAALYFNWFYLKMLIYPKELSFYYGYNQIPIATWSYWQVWVSLLIYLPATIYGIFLFVKRKVLGFGIVFFVGVMMGVNNTVFLLPGIVADRFTYILSLGFVIIIVALMSKVFNLDFATNNKKISISNSFSYVFSLIFLIYAGRTIARNPDWHDYLHLFNNDIEHLGESAKAHTLISNTLYAEMYQQAQNNSANFNQNDVQKVIFHYKESIRIDSNYTTSYNNLGSVYFNFLGDYKSTIYYCEKAVALDENYIEAHFNLGFSYKALSNINKSIHHYKRIIEIDPDYVQVYNPFIRILTENDKVKEGVYILDNIAKSSKNPKNIFLCIGNLYSNEKTFEINTAIKYFEKAFEFDKTDKGLCNHLANLYKTLGNVEKTNYYLGLCNN